MNSLPDLQSHLFEIVLMAATALVLFIFSSLLLRWLSARR
jgi:hypothetical protein